MASDALVLTAVVGSGAVSAAADLRTRRVPNAVTFCTGLLGVVLAAIHVSGLSVTNALGGLVLGGLLMLPGHLIGRTGAGDVKLFAALGTLLGPQRIVFAFLYTAIAGGALATLVAVRRGRLRTTLESTATLVCTGGRNVPDIEHPSADNRFAYAPAIALGAFLAAFGV